MTNQPTNAEPPTLPEYINTRITELENHSLVRYDDVDVNKDPSLALMQAGKTAKLAELKHLRHAVETDGVRSP